MKSLRSHGFTRKSQPLLFFLSILLILFADAAQAQHKGMNFQAVVKRTDGTKPTASGVTVTVQFLDPVTNCVLREEEHSGKNISNGYLNLVLGDNSAATPLTRNPTPLLSIAEVMDNKKSRTGLKCVDISNQIIATNQSYTPSGLDRRVVRLRFNVEGDEIVADFNMRSVGFAVNSEMLNSKTEQDFVNVNTAKSVTQANVESVFERFTKLDAILNGFNAGGTASAINITGNAATATTATNVSGTVAIANGGTGATTAAGARTSLGLGALATVSPTGTADATTYLRGDGTWSTVPSGGGGGLSSVGLNLPTDVFQITGSPLTADGTMTATLKSQTAKQVFSAPNGADGAPSFRQLQVSDISNTGSASLYNVPVTGDAGTTEVVKGDDSRLINSRPPTDGSVTTVKIADGAVTDAKIADLAATKLTGTVPSARLPIASGTSDGIVNQLAQSFAGLKSFLNGLFVNGDAEITGVAKVQQLVVSDTSAADGGACTNGSIGRDAAGNIYYCEP